MSINILHKGDDEDDDDDNNNNNNNICRTARLVSRKVKFMNYAWESFLFSRKETVNMPDNLGRRV